MPPARAFATADPLNRRVVDQMLIGVTTRQYARSLEPLGADITTRGTSKRAVSRRVVAQTQAQLDAWSGTGSRSRQLVDRRVERAGRDHRPAITASPSRNGKRRDPDSRARRAGAAVSGP